MSILLLPALYIVPVTLTCLVDISLYIKLPIAVLFVVSLIILLFYFTDKVDALDRRKNVVLNYTEKSKRAKTLIDLDTHNSVMSVANRTHSLKVYFIDFEFFITEFIKNSDKAYDTNKIRELDNQIRE